MTAAENVFRLHADEPPPPEPDNAAEVFPSPSAPLDVVRVLMKEHTDETGLPLLRKWRDDWWRYRGPHYELVDPASLRKWVYSRTEHAVYAAKTKDGGLEDKPWQPDKGKVDRVVDALVTPTLLNRDVEAPVWLHTGQSAAGYVPCTNGLVDVNTQQLVPHTPQYFGTVCIPFDYSPTVGPAVEWLKFLRTLWPAVQVVCSPDTCTLYPGTCNGWHEAEEVRTLQQWFGYVLSGRLDLQKMLLLVGPPRSGKGTVARILRDLVGKANTSAPTLAGMAQNFGLETTIGKTLSIVGDARLASHGQEAVVERLLSISGQDTITLDRKNRTAWTGTLQTRIMVLSNELPKFGDASGAIASRFVILKLEQSFLGKEDVDLEQRLRAEFPAILKWALDGLVSLNQAKRMLEPPSHHEAMQELYDLVSPITAFAREVLDTSSVAAETPFTEVYREYETWCSENSRGVTNTARFSNELKARLPHIKTDVRPRDDAGRKLPRHVRGVAISNEWRTRVRENQDPWRMGGQHPFS